MGSILPKRDALMLLHQMRPRQAAWFARDEVGLDAGLRRRNPGGCLCLDQSRPEQDGQQPRNDSDRSCLTGLMDLVGSRWKGVAAAD
jgi:hypothetical protein